MTVLSRQIQAQRELKQIAPPEDGARPWAWRVKTRGLHQEIPESGEAMGWGGWVSGDCLRDQILLPEVIKVSRFFLVAVESG